MKILLPTGRVTEQVVRDAARGFDADVVVTGELASFLTPSRLAEIISSGRYDLVIVSGMCTASFRDVEEKTGVPIRLGPRHAADLSLVLPFIGKTELSRETPADDLLSGQRKEEAFSFINRNEDESPAVFQIKGVKIGGTSRMKVLAEIMDAHHQPDIRKVVERYFRDGADIVDLGFGFDASPEDVRAVFDQLRDLPGPLAADTQDPVLIKAALPGADLVLSLQEENIREAAPALVSAGSAAVVIPGNNGLVQNIRLAGEAGIRKIIADPILNPGGSGLVQSLCRFRGLQVPLFFGAGNVMELIDADSPGMCALLAVMAHETGTSVIFCSEHSDKTKGCISEMRRATEMMVLLKNRPYPKDLGIDLLVLKEKRRRREPPVLFTSVREAERMPGRITYDPCGNFRIGIQDGYIVAERHGLAIRGERWQDIFYSILQEEGVSLLDHAGYLGAELFKAELALRYGRSFEQDGPF